MYYCIFVLPKEIVRDIHNIHFQKSPVIKKIRFAEESIKRKVVDDVVSKLVCFVFKL